MRIVIAGGHLTPALSVIEALPKEAEVIYLGRKYSLEGDSAISLEYETITEKSIPFVILKTGRIQRSLTRHTIPSLAKIPVGFTQAMIILKKIKPDVVLGFGGYISFPVIFAASVLRIPTVIHEQTLEAGAANKFASKFVDKICISFESSLKYFPKEKTILTGNPIRKSISGPIETIDIKTDYPIIYITGGSTGSHAINLLVSGCLAKLLDKYTVIHQTGDTQEFKDFDRLSILKEGLNNNKRDKYIISKFFSPEVVGDILMRSSLVVTRAGINTVSELIYLEKPSLLIPIPTTQRNEQLKNAQFLKRLGLGEVIEQKNLTSDEFLKVINKMTANIKNYKLKSDDKYFPKNAAAKIIDVIYAAAKNNH